MTPPPAATSRHCEDNFCYGGGTREAFAGYCRRENRRHFLHHAKDRGQLLLKEAYDAMREPGGSPPEWIPKVTELNPSPIRVTTDAIPEPPDPQSFRAIYRRTIRGFWEPDPSVSVAGNGFRDRSRSRATAL